MHCTWFNEKKKSSFPPYIYFCGFFFSSPDTSPHLSPSLPFACPSHHYLGKERPLPAQTTPPGPAGLQLPTSPGRVPRRPRLPQCHSTPRPDCLRRKGRTRPGRGPPPPPLLLAQTLLANRTEKSLHFDRASRPARPAPHPGALLLTPRESPAGSPAPQPWGPHSVERRGERGRASLNFQQKPPLGPAN